MGESAKYDMLLIAKLALLGAWGALTSFVLDTDNQARLCTGAPEALRGQLDLERDISTIRTPWVGIPLTGDEMGHYVLSVVARGRRPSCVDRGPNLAASFFEWTLLTKRPDLSTGGLHLPCTDDELLRVVPPENFLASTAVSLGGDARGDSVSDPRDVVMDLHVNWDMHRPTSSKGRRRIRRLATLVR